MSRDADWAFASLHSQVCEFPNLRQELRRHLRPVDDVLDLPAPR